MIQKITLWLALAFTIIFVVVPTQMAEARTIIVPSIQITANDLIAEVNALRSAHGLAPYLANPVLMQIAQDQANYMAATGQVAHRPGLTQRILDAGYPLAGDLSLGGFRAENIIGNVTSAAQAVQSWTGDAPHLDTMLSPNLTEIGAGVARVGDRYYMAIDAAQPTAGRAPQPYTPIPAFLSTQTFSPGEFVVPVTLNTPDANGMVYHEVQSGQSLWAIAIQYGVKIDEIRALNNLGPGTDIYQGDRLLVRIDAPLRATITPASTDSGAESTLPLSSTVSPTATLFFSTHTETPVNVPLSRQSILSTGVVVGIILAATLLAGILTWTSSRRKV